MELRHLRYFVAVAEELHFGRAAGRLMIAQPPLSQQIQNLEREVGARLFRRTNRRVELSDAGRAFLADARRALDGAEQAVQAARRAERGEVGRLVIGFVSSATYAVLPPVLRGFRRARPGVELVLRERTTAEQVEALEARQLDLGFVRTPPPSPRLAHRVLAEEDFVAALPQNHRLARGRKRVALGDLRDEAFLLFPRTMAMGLYDRVLGACLQAGFSPRVIQEVTQPAVMIGLVAAGLGVALVPECVQALKWKNVAYRPLNGPVLATNVTLVWRRDDESEAVRAFVEQAGHTLT